jgi:hypothetical protein
MECDQPTLPKWVVDSPSLHDFLDIESLSNKAILDIMDSIDGPQDEMIHRSSSLDSEPMRFNMRSLDPQLGAFVGASSRPPSLGPFPHCLSFSELTIEFSTNPSIEDSRFIPPLHIDEHHQGASISHETTHYEFLRLRKFISIWHGPNMVSRMKPILAHEFIDDDQDP